MVAQHSLRFKTGITQAIKHINYSLPFVVRWVEGKQIMQNGVISRVLVKVVCDSLNAEVVVTSDAGGVRNHQLSQVWVRNRKVAILLSVNNARWRQLIIGIKLQFDCHLSPPRITHVNNSMYNGETTNCKSPVTPYQIGEPSGSRTTSVGIRHCPFSIKLAFRIYTFCVEISEHAQYL